MTQNWEMEVDWVKYEARKRINTIALDSPSERAANRAALSYL